MHEPAQATHRFRAMAVYAATRRTGVTSWPSRNWTLRLNVPIRKPNRCCDVARRGGPARGRAFGLARDGASGGGASPRSRWRSGSRYSRAKFRAPPPDPAGRKMGEGSGRRDRAGPSRVSPGPGDYKGGAGVPICRRALASRSKGSSVCLASVSWRPGHALARKSEVTSPEGLAALCERAR